MVITFESDSSDFFISSSVTGSEYELKQELDKISKEKDLVEKRMIELERKLEEMEHSENPNYENEVSYHIVDNDNISISVLSSIIQLINVYSRRKTS